MGSRESLLRDMIVENEKLKAHAINLEVKVEQLTPPPAPVRDRPAHITEEEAEAKFQLDNKLIDVKEYKALLAELDFQNADIQLDPDYEYESRPGLSY